MKNYKKAIILKIKEPNYKNHYISEDEKEVVFEFKESLCIVYDIRKNIFYESSFLSEEDLDKIEVELNNKNYKEKREDKKEKKTIKFICTKYIQGLSINGIQFMLDYWTLPSNIKLLLKEVSIWYSTFNDFKYWEKNKFEEKVFKKSIKYKKWEKEGNRILKKAKRMSLYSKNNIYLELL